MIAMNRLSPGLSVEATRTVLVCFHASGGSASSFAKLARDLLPCGCQVLAYSLPISRETKRRVYTDTKVIVKELYEGLKRILPGLVRSTNKTLPPIVFFGHSLGALLAFEFSRLCWRETDPSLRIPIQALVVSAVRSPDVLSESNIRPTQTPRHLLSDEDLLSYIEEIGGLPANISRDFLRATVPILKDDYKAFESYSFEVNEDEGLKLQCPLFVMGANEDKSVKVADLTAWVSLLDFYENESVELTLFRGSHFYAFSENESKRNFQEKLIAILESVVSSL